MTKRIFRSICLIALTVAVSCVLLVAGGLYSYFTNQQQNNLRVLTMLASDTVSDMGIESLRDLEDSGYRITLIDSNGNVLYDTRFDPKTLTNHLEREEIREAIETGSGESSRFSDSLTEYQFYSAQRLDDGSIIRLSISQSTVFVLIFEAAVPLIIIFLFALIISLFLAFRLSKQIVKPLNELDLDDPLSNKGYDEINPLLIRISVQQVELKRQQEELERRQTEFNTIVEGMNEGLVLISSKGVILGINSAAMKLLSLSPLSKGKDFMTQVSVETVRKIVSDALFGQTSEDILSLSGSTYSIKADPVITDNLVEGVVLIMLDITDKMESENMRREFTANVSHELKTPLHSISGYAELMVHKMVKDEDIPLFAGKIYQESGRLINLVEDIIRLSHLDEGAGSMEFIPTDLLSCAREASSILEDAAKSASISLDVTGESVIINAVPTLISEIIYNLTDNGIKYNREGGKVNINIQRCGDKAILTVSDTGIGIPEEHRQRIFERFYRVDKSRSKNAGGTGLGLSIVKHAAMIHSAEIKLESIKDKGTKVQVIFPIA